MKNLLLKLRLIFWPFVRLVVLVASGYAVLMWGLHRLIGYAHPSDFSTVYWSLVGLGAVMAFIFLRPRIKLLRFSGDGRQTMLFYLTAVVVIGFAANSSAQLLEEGSRRLVILDSIYELPRHAGHYGYVVRNFYLDIARLTSDKTYSSGKDGTTLTLSLTAPLLRTSADTVHSGAYAWLGTSSLTTESTRHNVNIYAAFREFTTAETLGFQTQMQGYTYLVRASPTPGLLAAARRHPVATQLATEPIILLARHEPFAHRIAEPLLELIKTLFFGFIAFFLLLLCFPFRQVQLQHYCSTGRFPASDIDELAQGLQFMRPRPGFQFTPLLIGLNLAVFALMAASGLGLMDVDVAELIRWGACYGPAIRGGEWWRLLTGTFLHAGLVHLLNNIWALGFAGWALERMVGWRWLGLTYALSALAGGLVSLAWHPSGLSVGASGAIMGLYGLGLVLTWRRPSEKLPVELEVFRTVAGMFVVTNMLLGIASVRVDGAAHLGGVIAGMLCGALLRSGVNNPSV